MAAVTAFGDFVAETAPKIWGGVNDLVNNLQKNTYLLPRFLMGRDFSETSGGGERIRAYLLTDPNGTFQFVGVNSPSNWTNPQMTSKVEIPYRFTQVHFSHVAQETDLNEGDPKVQWKSVRNTKLMGCWTDLANGFENALFAIPDKSKMEDFNVDAGSFYSIPAFVNQHTNGLFPSYTPGGAWTTIEGLAPSSGKGWLVQQQAYDNLTATDAANLVTKGFDNMFYKVRFESPGMREQYFQTPRLYRQFIACSRQGVVNYKHLLRQMQDLLVMSGRQDPAYMNPTYAGIDLLYVANLDTATLYPDAVASTTLKAETAGSGTADISGPRYYWLNANFLHFVWHPKWYLKMLDEFSPEAQRTTYITPIQSWGNMFCTSLRNQGLVYPTTDV